MGQPDSGPTGRPRDAEIDAAVMAATLELLSEVGYEALTFAAIAERAGTSRPAVYRRYETKAAAATAALGSLSAATAPERTGDPFADLAAELRAFRDGTVAAHGTSLVGAMLAETTDPAVKQRYREIVVGPRRRRLQAILQDARDQRLIDASDDELQLAVSMCTGSWHHLMLAGIDPSPAWPERIATLVWRSVGGSVPDGGRF